MKIKSAEEAKQSGLDVSYKIWTPTVEQKHSQSDDSEFDVVKKRRKMNPTSEDGESASDALAVFEEFEASVLPALERIAEDENEFRRRELVEMEESFAKGEAMSTTGGVYFAWSECLRCMKIGATRKEDPHVRLRQLSSFVTTPFILAAWLPTPAWSELPTPFQLEAMAHLHFGQQWINQGGSGAGTEFFRIRTADAEVVEYVEGCGEHIINSCEDSESCEVDDEISENDKVNELQLALDMANKKLTRAVELITKKNKAVELITRVKNKEIELIKTENKHLKEKLNQFSWAEQFIPTLYEMAQKMGISVPEVQSGFRNNTRDSDDLGREETGYQPQLRTMPTEST